MQAPEFKQSEEGLAKKGFDRVWRGNKAGTIKATTYPDFYYKTDEESLLKKREWVKEHLALCFRLWGRAGYNVGVAGHITVRDPILRDHYWMNPFGLHFSLITKSSLCLVTPEGYVHPEIGAQLPINMAGFHIHSAIHRARPEVEAAGHCHSSNGKAWSVFGRPIDITTQDSCLFYDNLSVYKSFGGIVLADEEGNNIARAIGPKNKAIVLQNHGLLTLGETVDEMCTYFMALDSACGIQLQIEAASASGIQKQIIEESSAKFTASAIQNGEALYFSLQSEIELMRALHPDTLN
ncbi:hypothetical protein CspeluHIS016_0301080 [Cutaneotrichosporon spelunceum]|uniref:Class II aldolase/adducin N-terminal domain-containing protein n=1 Tax=Cutaneotrichosporon spelunceum TaxID=1672016 RepID=A0AAD3TTA4_9TREE|nr:hypothetical protein CspeluHIS016_0301080 [Cutaneotrichosporon spelunceum]